MTSTANGAPSGSSNGVSTANGSGSSSSSQLLRQTPLTCSGHTRPVVCLAFSDVNPEDEGAYFCISACKGKERRKYNNHNERFVL